MAKKLGRLAGLAALGAAAYMLRNKDGDDAGEQKTSSYTGDTKKVEAENFKPSNESSYTPGSTGTARPGVGDATNDPRPAKRPSLSMKGEDTSPKDTAPLSSTTSSSEKGMKNYVPRRKSTVSSSAEGMKNYAPRRKLSPVDQIPGQDRSGPTGGERVSGTELSRNVSNTMNALAPLGGGVGKIGAELATAGRAQRGYNAAQAARRSAEGMSPAEALAAKEAAAQAAREAKTLNPNAWLAGPKGMAENFRKGGKVKKMASGGMTASSRADGIASRGKTKCKMY